MFSCIIIVTELLSSMGFGCFCFFTVCLWFSFIRRRTSVRENVQRDASWRDCRCSITNRYWLQLRSEPGSVADILNEMVPSAWIGDMFGHFGQVHLIRAKAFTESCSSSLWDASSCRI